MFPHLATETRAKTKTIARPGLPISQIKTLKLDLRIIIGRKKLEIDLNILVGRKVAVKAYPTEPLTILEPTNPPTGLFQNLRTSQSGYRRILLSSRTSNDGFCSSNVSKGSVGQLNISSKLHEECQLTNFEVL